MIILIPILVPIGAMMGFNPIHFGILMVIALNLGGITPPVGMLLFLTTSLAETTLSDTSKYIWIFIAVFIFVIIVIALIPEVVTFIPKAVLG
jgi:TRAP-type C4-dicarboxylate transport system permease large subunit